jgi:hypothetical protein
MLWLVCLIAFVALCLACEAWDRASLRRWHAGRDRRRAENRAWVDAQHARRMATWEAEAAAATRWDALVARHPWVAHMVPWSIALVLFMGVVLLAAHLS